MNDTKYWAIWNTQLKMWMGTGRPFKKRLYLHTTEEVDTWMELYKKDPDKSPKSLIIFSADDLIKGFTPLSEKDEKEKSCCK